jgi:hypothetical protein
MSVTSELGQVFNFNDRVLERTSGVLQAVVQVKETEKNTWKEVTDVKSVSRNGAGFILSRPCKVGRLVTMVMPLDPALRAYDHDKKLYPVMGIVQYCNPAPIKGETKYHVGVGFVGKNIPESFRKDPAQNFRILGMSKEGLWQVVEAGREFKKRQDPRFWISIGIIVSAVRSSVKEKTHTKNISARGLSIASALDTAVGEKVKLSCPDLDFYAFAVVRNRNKRKGETPILHLELLETEFPIDKLIASQSPELPPIPISTAWLA